MKTVFSNSELPHIWAAQTQDHGRSGSMFFDGNTIYSYGHHFPAAKIYPNNFVLMNSDTYSNTTARHLNHIWYAVNHREIIRVPEPEIDLRDKEQAKKQHKKNIEHFLELIENLAAKHLRARKYSYADEISKAKKDIKKYTEYFKLKLTKAQKEIVNAEIEETAEKVIKYEKKISEQKKRKELKHLKEWTGDNKLKSNRTGVHLRINGDQVQTNKGAQVPIKEAKILWHRIKTGKDIKGFQIGYYTVISINGTLKIGCHEITKQEMKRFTEFYKW